MKSIIRLAALSLAGSLLIGSLFGNATRALALPQEQIMKILETVPVFALMNQQGGILLATPTQGDNKTPVAGIFIDGQDAQNFLNNLKQKNPQAANGAQVVPVSLAKIYQLSQEKKDQVQFVYVPHDAEVQAAQAILQQNGQQNTQFQGVPLFTAQSSDAGGAYLTIQQGDHQIVPMFFSRQELQAVLDRLKQVEPALAQKMKIQVVNLEGVEHTLQSSNNQDLNQIQLDPADTSIQFVRTFQQANPGAGQAAGATPAPAAGVAPAGQAPAGRTPAGRTPAQPARPQTAPAQPHQ